MAKFRGLVGFVLLTETTPGVYTEVATTRTYSGDVLRQGVRWEKGGQVIDDLVISNQISIVGDKFINQNLATMRYVEYMGSKWKISFIEVKPPRLILNLGDVYNGN